MKIKTQEYNGVVVVDLQGELDSEVSESLQMTVTDILSAQRSGIVLDMSKVNFIDSEGLERLLWIRDYCGDSKCQFKLAGLDENCLKILEVTRLNNEFSSYAELTEAVKSFV